MSVTNCENCGRMMVPEHHDCGDLCDSCTDPAFQAGIAEGRRLGAEEATARIQAEAIRLAAALVRLGAPDTWPRDAIQRGPVVDIAMRLKNIGEHAKADAKERSDV